MLVGINLFLPDVAFDLCDLYGPWAFGNRSFLEIVSGGTPVGLGLFVAAQVVQDHGGLVLESLAVCANVRGAVRSNGYDGCSKLRSGGAPCVSSYGGI